MPSYADEMAARQSALPSSSGPVRLWISRGEVVRGADGREYVAEIWEEESIMDTDVISSVDSDYTRQQEGKLSSLADSLRSTLKGDGRREQLPTGGSLMVLDTNTLLSSLSFCMAVFTQCLARNAHALAQNAFVVSPIMLIIPNAVVRELDGLKSSTRKDSQVSSLTIGQRAQRANRWVLEATIQQKKRSYDVTSPDGIVLRSDNVPEQAWALHIENSAHVASARLDGTYRDETPDDEIISLCRILKRETQQSVCLCSDDVNAKLKAESDAILSFSATDWTREFVGSRGVDERDPRLREAVSDLLDQWSSQLDSNAPQVLPVAASAMDTDDFSVGARATTDSVYAATNTPTPPYAPHAMQSRIQRSPPLQLQQQQRVRVHGNHAYHSTTAAHSYTADRSSASSRWAR